MKTKVKEEMNVICTIRLEMLDSIYVISSEILATWEHVFTQTGNTHSEGQGWWL